MTEHRMPPPGGVPTLTEIVDAPAATAPVPAAPGAAAVSTAAAPATTVPVIDEEELTRRVLARIEQHVDATLESRLRAALVHTLAGMADAVIHDVRTELTGTLRDAAARAVAQELLRRPAR
jgi:3-oxoacyl-ACP reductase-like protein